METGHILMSQLFPQGRIGVKFLEELRQKTTSVRHFEGSAHASTH